MPGKFLISTAYLPPVQYMSVVADAEEVIIEREENYLKQTYRNRCYILSANGVLALSVPVRKGSELKIKSKDIEIDYSKRWQQIHLRAITSAYRSSAYFDFYYELIEQVILKNHRFLFDLNDSALQLLLKLIEIETKVSYTSSFLSVSNSENDLRYSMSPKSLNFTKAVNSKEYFQLFPPAACFVPNLSVIDLLFNTGPDSLGYLK